MGRLVRFGWVLGVLAAIGAATALVAVLESGLNLDNASSLYLVAVAGVAIRWGTMPAVATAFGGILIYNLLFLEPRNSFAVAVPEDLNLLHNQTALRLKLRLFVRPNTIVADVPYHLQRD